MALDRIQKGLKFAFAKAGPATLGVNFVDDGALAEGMLRPYYAITSYEYAGDRVEKTGIARVELRAIRRTVSGRHTSAKKDFQLPTSLIRESGRGILCR